MVYFPATTACSKSTLYKGKVAVAGSKWLCQAWTSQSLNKHVVGTKDSEFPDGSIAAAKNYCRDPDGRGFPWCYVNNPEKEWEACAVDLCGE